MVEQADADAVEHVRDADDDGQLHFVRVEPRDLVVRQLPHLATPRRRHTSLRHTQTTLRSNGPHMTASLCTC